MPAAGVAAASGGNHGVAVAYAAHRLGIPAKIFVPIVSSPAKIERIRQFADLVIGGDRYADALQAAQQWIATSGAMSVPAYVQRETILGQATLALELDDQAGPLDTVLVPVGGGGLIAGIASCFAGAAWVIGVEPDGAPTLFRARAAGAPADAPAGSIAVDALAPRRVGDLVFPITQAYVEDVVLVDDDAIRLAQRTLWQSARIAAEPGRIGRRRGPAHRRVQARARRARRCHHQRRQHDCGAAGRLKPGAREQGGTPVSASAELRFRAACPGDAQAIAALHAGSWQRHYRGAFSDAFLDHDAAGYLLPLWTARLATPDPRARTIRRLGSGASR